VTQTTTSADTRVDTGVRAPAPEFTSGLRHAAADWKGLAQARQHIRRPSARNSWLGLNLRGPWWAKLLPIAEVSTTESRNRRNEREQIVQLLDAFQGRQPQHGQPLRHGTQHFDPLFATTAACRVRVRR